MLKIAKEHYLIYDEFVRDLRHNDTYPFIRYIEEYDNQEVIKLCVSQHQGLSENEQKKLTTAWVEYLSNHILNVKEVQVCTIMNQKCFDAICNQINIESLRIKWFRGKDISNICQLNHLKKLFIENASSLENISSLTKMKNLEVLILGHTKKVYDYSCLKELKQLKVLGICSYRTSLDVIIPIKSTDFIQEMPSLEYVDLIDTKKK